VLLTIDLNRDEKDAQIYAEILPYLETNLYRPRVLNIKKADIALHTRALLGWALQTKSVRNKSNLLWMSLSSGNHDVVLQSDQEDSEQVVVEVAASVLVEVATNAASVEVAAIAPLVAAVTAPVEEVAARAQER
jgi:hypothetical protein